jgi:hypothetical protein
MSAYFGLVIEGPTGAMVFWAGVKLAAAGSSAKENQIETHDSGDAALPDWMELVSAEWS